jgi:hypothetical protein
MVQLPSPGAPSMSSARRCCPQPDEHRQGLSQRGKHNQSIDPVEPINAADRQSEISA